jgi:hypothetical protein
MNFSHNAIWKIGRGLALALLLLASLTMLPCCTAQTLRSVLQGPIENTSVEELSVDKTPIREPFKLDHNVSDQADIDDDDQSGVPIDAGEKIDALITKLVLKNIPHQFHENKDWGRQELRFSGIDLRRDGLKIRTRRKRKMVNHGTWRKYEVSLLNPADQFSISVKNMRSSDEGKMAFDVHVGANLKIDGRQAKWVNGVQVFNVSIDGKTKIELKTTIELRTLMDMTKFPPDLVFRPHATVAEILLKDFRIDRISKVGGELTQQVSRIAKRSIEGRLEAEETKVLSKLNKEFENNADKLTLSLHDAMSPKWSAAAQKFMPRDIQKALQE